VGNYKIIYLKNNNFSENAIHRGGKKNEKRRQKKKVDMENCNFLSVTILNKDPFLSLSDDVSDFWEWMVLVFLIQNFLNT